MSTIHVRSVPEELYERIQKLAASKNHSLSAEVILLLDRAVEAEESRKQQAQLLSNIRRRRFSPPAGTTDSLKLLHEDRSR